MEERRMLAADLFEQDIIPAEIARRLDVGHQTVMDWRAAWRRSGRAGRLPKLNRDQLAPVAVELAKGAEANGYPNDLWTLEARGRSHRAGDRGDLPPSARLVQLARSVEFGAGSARPAEPSNVTMRRSTTGSSSAALAATEKGAASEGTDHLRRRVWHFAAAPVRATGRLEVRRLLRLGSSGSGCRWPGRWSTNPYGSDAHLVFQLRPGAYNDERLIDFLSELTEHKQQRPVLLIWDGLPSHRSRRMQDWVASQPWLTIELLPGYAPDLHPMEQVWGRLKSAELANLCSDTIDEVVSGMAGGGLQRIGSDASLCFAFLRHAGLRL
jgi:transposase